MNEATPGRLAGPSSALSLFTIVGPGAPPVPAALPWFGVVGWVLGLALGGIWIGLDEFFPPLVVAAAIVAADLTLTGMLHFDGLADTGDSMIAPMSRETRLRVMTASDVGAFGVGLVLGVMLLRFAALASLEPDPWLLASAWATGRAFAALVLQSRPYGSDGDLAAAFRGGPRTPLLVGLLVLAVGSAAVSGVQALLAVAIGVLVGVLVIRRSERLIGGFTGDLLGASIILVETTALVAATAS